ncbi:HET-domain-containing protein [Trametes coccinea BRFM310]|uniref:HET-domain-containing protein n=1 Tax=Trametes coccinea (strain BRFM310) TaxID=1353009 RepID=A0A1Y2IEZ7_TRAC3|nr:HET-domain-containing protein [Trametes coccinea BRFM310]
MYLINTTSLTLHRFEKSDKVPHYAILSHVWGDHEQSFQQTPLAKPHQEKKDFFHRMVGYARHRPSAKVKGACAKARADGFEWLWADMSCIDTSNSAELGETINSMFDLYKRASMCYAYLHDVPPREDPHSPTSCFRKSRWFTRAWTLQELIAPGSIIFLSYDWQVIGPKWRLAPLIESITGIDRLVLTHKRDLNDVSIACRMSWAANRQARREEDRAYSLMGIFGVSLPTIYGEKQHAFIRLQEEIIRRSQDQSIFAWGAALKEHSTGTVVTMAQEHDYESQKEADTLLASSPAEFAGCAGISTIPIDEFAHRIGQRSEDFPLYTQTGGAIFKTTIPLVPIVKSDDPVHAVMLGLLCCVDNSNRIVGLFLRRDPKVSSMLRVGGYIADGSRFGQYCRTTHLSARETHIMERAMFKDVNILASRQVPLRGPLSSASSSCSSRRKSLVFFEPPCTVRFSRSSCKALAAMGFKMPVIPEAGFRLTGSGEMRSISFLGYWSFTVYFGTCLVDYGPESLSAPRAKLWATVTFDSDLDSLLVEDDGSDITETGAVNDVLPDQSMLVELWRDHRKTFGPPNNEVRLTFDCLAHSSAVDRGMAETYELEIRYQGYYGTEQRRRYKPASARSYSISGN